MASTYIKSNQNALPTVLILERILLFDIKHVEAGVLVVFCYSL